MEYKSKFNDVIYFDKAGKQNTGEILIKTKEYVEANGKLNYIIISSTTGYTAIETIKVFKDYGIPMIVCMQDLNEEFSMKKEVLNDLKSSCEVYDIPKKYLADIIGNAGSNILRNFSQGTKVCIELLVYLVNNSKVNEGDKLVVLAGTLKGADTAISFEVKKNKKFKVLSIIGFPQN